MFEGDKDEYFHTAPGSRVTAINMKEIIILMSSHLNDWSHVHSHASFISRSRSYRMKSVIVNVAGPFSETNLFSVT